MKSFLKCGALPKWSILASFMESQPSDSRSGLESRAARLAKSSKPTLSNIPPFSNSWKTPSKVLAKKDTPKPLLDADVTLKTSNPATPAFAPMLSEPRSTALSKERSRYDQISDGPDSRPHARPQIKDGSPSPRRTCFSTSIQEEQDELPPLILEAMEAAISLPHEVPIKIDLGFGDNWLQAH